MKLSLHYRLQPLLTLKEKAKQKAEALLAKAIARLEEEKKRLKKLEEEKAAIVRRRRETRWKLHQKVSSGKALVKDGSDRVSFLKRLEEEEKAKEEEIAAVKRAIADCEVQVKRARRDYIDAVKELRVMEKHKALWQKKLDLELSRLEEKEMDELGNIIHQLKKVA